MTENLVVFDTSPFDDLNVLLDANMNGRYYHRRVSNPLTSMASLKLSVVVLYMHPINPKKKSTSLGNLPQRKEPSPQGDNSEWQNSKIDQVLG